MRNLFRCVVCLAVAVWGWTAPARAQNDPESRRAAIDAIYPIMINALEAKNFGRARNICDQVIMWEPQNPVHHYNLACIEAQAGGTRIPYAWGALELAIALGFNDADHLQRDPDLAPLRSDPKFADLVRKITFNATAGEAITSVAVPEMKGKSAKETASVVERPAPAGFQNDLPVGLYLMARYRSSNQTFEQSAWYFAPDGTVYENLQQGFSQADLVSHVARRGQGKRQDRVLEISWADGTNSKSDLERDGSDFTWDLGIFSPISAFQDASELAGVYEGDAPPDPGAVRSGTQRLELQRDGTFRWSGGIFVDSRRTSSAAPQNKEIVGKWELSGFSLLLTRIPDGNVMRTLAFPDDDIKTVVKPDRMFFGGSMLKRRP